MATIFGEYFGTTFDDFLIHPGRPEEDDLIPDSVNLSSDICGIRLGAPFFTAAMRSITGNELAYAAGKGKMMAVAPRGLTPERQVEIVRFVRDREIKPGEIESETDPEIVYENDTLGTVLMKTREFGHSNIPVKRKQTAEFVGMFAYKPSKHDLMDPRTLITEVMMPFKNAAGSSVMEVCHENMSDQEIDDFLREREYRFTPVLDSQGRLSRLVFMQRNEAYKIGAAISTKDWERRADMLVEAGADMIFIDTSDAYTSFSRDVVQEFKKRFTEIPICAGNIVTPEAFEYLALAGVDAVKVGMGPGSICSTNEVLGVGAPPFSAIVRVCEKRDSYAEKERYVPVIADGGIKTTANINVALTHADGVMGGSMFGCFEESAGQKVMKDGRVVAVRIYGEASKESFRTSGDMDRYTTPLDGDSLTTFQGVSGLIPYKGRFKPGMEVYMKTLREALYHAGCANLGEYRKLAVLERLSENAREVAKPHGIQIVE